MVKEELREGAEEAHRDRGRLGLAFKKALVFSCFSVTTLDRCAAAVKVHKHRVLIIVLLPM